MIREMIALGLFALHIGVVCVAPASGRGAERAVQAERLEELERELRQARAAGNDAEVAEIEALLEKLRDTVIDRDEEESDAWVRDRLRGLERELKVARETNNEPEIAEIQELMARLAATLRRREALAGPGAGMIELALNGDSEVETSSAASGFALLYARQAKSQLAVMAPVGMLVAALDANETVTITVPLVRLDGPFQISAVAERWDGPEAQVSFSLDPAQAEWHPLEEAPVRLQADGQPRNETARLLIRIRSGAEGAVVRLTRLELTSEAKTYPLTLPLATLPIDQFPRPELPAMRPGIERALIEWDWRLQDGIGTERESRSFHQAIETTLERGDALIAHLTQAGAPMDRARSQWARLRHAWRRLKEARDVSETDWENLWRRVHRLRRRIALQNPLAKTGPIAFVKGVPTNNSIMQHQYIGRFARPGGGIFVLEQPGQSMRCRALTRGKLSRGAYQHLDVSYDGTRVLFSFCPLDRPPREARHGNPGRYFDIYEIEAGSHRLRPLIVSDHDDIAPRYLPDGNIVFISTRRGGYSRCGPDFAPCHTLTLARADGSDARLISFHEIHEYDPAVMNDGRLIYTRWDYVDREASLYQQLWITRPDGTNPAIYYGNNTFNPMATFEPRAIPGSNRIMALAGCHHSIAAGSVVLLDVTKGVDGLAPLERLTPDALFPETEALMRGGWDAPNDRVPVEQRRWPHHTYKSPLPLSEDVFLASYSFDKLIYIETEPNPANMFGLYLVDRFGNKELLYRDLNVSSLWAMPLQARPRQETLPKQSDPTGPAEGTLYVQNVYEADPPLPKDVKITALRIIHVYPRTSEFEMYPTIGLPVAACGREVLGTVPVEPDGSAYFTAPAGMSLAFQALDELGQSVQFMRSVAYLQPGEQVSCVGCHEHRMTAPPDHPMGRAVRRAPSAIRPGPVGSRPFSYPLLVQPVLDKHCVRCHGGERTDGDIVLTGNMPISEDEGEEAPFSISYYELAPLVRYAQWGSLEPDQDFRISNSEPITQPDFFGARSSSLIALLRAGHEGVQLTDQEFERLVTWADNNALFYGTFDPDDQARQRRGQRIAGPLID